MVAKKMGVDGFFYNSSLEFHSNGILKRIHYQGDEGPTKARYVKIWLTNWV